MKCPSSEQSYVYDRAPIKKNSYKLPLAFSLPECPPSLGIRDFPCCRLIENAFPKVYRGI